MPPVIVATALALSKVGLAVAGAVGATGFFAVGASGLAAVALGAAVVVGGALVAKKAMSLFEIDIPTVDTDTSRQRTVKSTTEPQKIIYGEALVSGPISFVGLAGTDNEDFYQAIVLAGHKLNNITDIHMDDLVIPNADINSGNAAGGQVGGSGPFGFKNSSAICTINKHLGAASQTADSLLTPLPNYTTSHRGDGIAYLAMKWTLNEHSAKTWEKYSPQNVKALVQGKSIYDPRLDVTAGNDAGANPTNASYIAYSTNPALCLADYLMDATLGMGISAAKIDWAAIITAANGCDVSVSVPGGTEARFSCNGVIFATDKHQKNINKILSSMNGSLVYSNGKYILHAGIYEAPTESLNEDDLIGAISIKTSLERSDRFNTIKGLFVDPSQNHKSSEFPKVQLADAVTRDNGEVLEKEVQYPMTNSSYGAQRLSHKLIQLSDQQKIITFPANLSALRIAAGDRVRVSVEELSWTNKVFQCVDWTFSEQGGVNLTLREDSSTSYADPTVTPTNEYSTITASGSITDAFRGVPSPSGLRAASGEGKVFLNWVNPGRPADYATIEVFSSSTNNVNNAVKIGDTDGTQFVHDGNNAADSIAVGNPRHYWIRSKKNVGTTVSEVSVYEPNSTTSSVSVTVLATAVNWSNVANPTIGIDLNADDTITIDLGDATASTSGNAVATSGIEEDVTITQGGIRMNQGGSIRGGQTSYNSGEGFFLGYDSNKYKLSVRTSTSEALTFDGSNLSVTGNITATSGTFTGTVNASAGAFTGDVSTDSKFIAGTGDATTVIDGEASATYRIFSGAAQTESENAPFQVKPDGSVFAKNITVFDSSGNILLDQDGLGAAALAGISLTSGTAVDKVSGVLSGDGGEMTLTLDQTATVTLETKFAIYDNSVGTLYLRGTGASSSAALSDITNSTLNIIYSLQTDGGSYSTAATKPITFTSTDSTPSSTEVYVTAALISGSYLTILVDAGGALEYIANTSTYGATAYVVTSHTFTNLAAGVHKVKLSSTITGSGSPDAAGQSTSNRLYELTSSAINFVESAANVFANGSPSVPSGGGTVSGNLIISGDLTVNGTTTTLNTQTLDVEDKNITVNYGAGDTSASADGAGFTIQDAVNSTTDATLLWKTATDTFEFSHPIKAQSDLTLSSAGGDAGIYWKDSSASDATAWHLHADVTQATTNLLLNYAGGGTNFSFVNNGNFLAPGTIFADGAASNSLQWEAGYDYSQVGHLPLTGGTLTGALQGTQIGLGGTPHSTAALRITTTNQHIRLNNGSELGVISLLSGGELDIWSHGDGETINLRTGSGAGTVALAITGTDSVFSGSVTSTGLTTNADATISTSGFTRLNINSTRTSGNIGGVDFQASGVIKGQIFGTVAGGMKLTSNGSTEALTIDSSQNVNIPNGSLMVGATTAPLFDLHVSDTNANIGIESTTNNQNASLYFRAHTANQWETGVNITAGLDYEIYDRANNSSRFVVRHSGNVNIPNGGLMVGATTAPTSALEISGGNNLASQIRLINTAPATDNIWTIHPQYNDQTLRFKGNGTTDVLTLADTGAATFSGSVSSTGFRFGNTSVGTEDDNEYLMSTGGQLIIRANDSAADDSYTYLILDSGNASGAASVSAGVMTRTNGVERLRVGGDGTIKFFEDTGTTAKMVWSPTSEELQFADNVKATFGAGPEIEIYSNGAVGYIDTAQLIIANAAHTNNIAKFIQAGAVELFHNNAQKLATTSTGIDVTGTATVDGLVVGGSATGTITLGEAGYNGTIQAPHSIALDAQGAGENVVIKTQSTERMRIGSTGIIYVNGDGTGGRLSGDGSGGLVLQDGNGRQSFKIMSPSSGSVQAMTLDANSNLLVGKTATAYGTAGIEARSGGTLWATASGTNAASFNRLSSEGTIAYFSNDGTEVGTIGSNAGFITLGKGDTGLLFHDGQDAIWPRNLSTGASRDGSIDLGGASDRFKDLWLSGTARVGNDVILGNQATTGTGGTARIVATGGQVYFQGGLAATSGSAAPIVFGAYGGTGERARLTSGGSFLVGKAVDNSFTTSGLEVFSTGAVNITGPTNGGVLYLNRKGTDGGVLYLYNDNSLVGSLGTANSGDLYIGNDDTTLLFAGGSDAIIPRGTAGAARDAAVSLGLSAHRFSDLYLSSNLKVGGSSSFQFQKSGTHGYINQSDTGDLIFRMGSGFLEKMRLQSDGILHITSGADAIAPTIKHSGATGQLAKLRVINRNGQGANKGGLLELGGVTNDEVTRSDVFASVAGLKLNGNSNVRTGYLQFSVSDGSTLQERARLTDDGKFGLGTASPADAIGISVPSGTTKGIYFQDSGTTNYGTILQYVEQTNLFQIKQEENGAQTGILTIRRADGNVGIGTSAPTNTYGQQLHIHSAGASGGSLHLTDSHSGATGTDGFELISYSHLAYVWQRENSDLIFGTNQTERARINNDGKFGLGTASPASLLHVSGASSSLKPLVDITNTSNSTVASCGLSVTGGGGSGGDGYQFRTKDTSGNVDFFIRGDGKVGIGTTAPSEKLEVNGNISFSGSASIQPNGTNTNLTIGTSSSGSSGLLKLVSTGDIELFQYGSSWATNVTFKADGNVGISVTPSAFVLPDGSSGALQLQSGGMVSAYNGVTHLSQNWYYNSGEKYIANGSASRLVMSGADYIWQSAGNNTSGAGAALTWSESMRLSGGTLLAGTTTVNGEGITLSGNNNYGYFSRSGDAALFVNRAGTDGDALGFRRGGAGVGSISVSGSATFYNTSSDQRLKENIADADDAGSKVDAIQVRKFDWKADGSHQDYGMIAQELIEVAPEAVSATEDPDEMMGVDYSKLVPMLIKEIQQLRKRVKDLEEE